MQITESRLRELVDAGMSQSEIAKSTGVPKPTVAWTMKKFGIKPARAYKRQESRETLERLYVREGLSVRSISKKLGRAEESIRKWMSQYGIQVRPRGTNQCGAPVTDEEFQRRIATFGHELLGNYKSVSQKVLFRCKCGNKHEAFPSVLVRGGCCPECGIKKAGISRRTKVSDAKKSTESRGDKFSSLYWDKGFARLVFQCGRCSHENDVRWQNYKKGQGCFECGILKGRRHPRWRDDLTTEEREQLGRYDEMYAHWKNSVKRRDNFTCQCCGQVGGSLVSHHVESYDSAPDKRTDLDNGITLCERCHKDFHSKYGHGNNDQSQLSEYMTDRARH